MKKVLKSLAALSLIMVASASTARPALEIEYIIRYYDNSGFEGEPVGGYTQYCNWEGSYGWGYPTIYGSYEQVSNCD